MIAKLSGDSTTQREAEEHLLRTYSKKHKVTLKRHPFPLPKKGRIEIDGFCESPPILCEVWSHVGTLKGSQPNKVMADALKLMFAKTYLKANPETILLFGDPEAAKPFLGASWRAQCLREYNIIIEVLPFSRKMKDKILKAQRKQSHKN